MASQIDSRERATRLARAIVADVKLYNDAKIKQGADLSAEVGEARELFRSRVTPELHSVFEDAIAEVPALAASWQDPD